MFFEGQMAHLFSYFSLLFSAVPAPKKSVSSASPVGSPQGIRQVSSLPLRRILQQVNETVHPSLASSSDLNESGILILHSLVDRVDSLAQHHLVDKQQRDVAMATLVKQSENHNLELKIVKKTLAKLEQKLDVVVPPANIKSQLPLLPVTSLEELEALENAIEHPEQKELLTRRLSQLGGSKFTTMIHTMMRTLLDKRVGIKYSLLGKTDKKPFVELKAYACIKGAFYYGMLLITVNFFCNLCYSCNVEAFIKWFRKAAPVTSLFSVLHTEFVDHTLFVLFPTHIQQMLQGERIWGRAVRTKKSDRSSA